MGIKRRPRSQTVISVAGVVCIGSLALGGCSPDERSRGAAEVARQREPVVALRNAPLAVEVSYATPVRAGDEVTFTVTATDPDSSITPGSCTHVHWFGDEEAVAGPCTHSCAFIEPSERPLPPIAPQPGSIVEEFRHVYAAPGEYKAYFAYDSAELCADDPYGSQGEAVVTVVVVP